MDLAAAEYDVVVHIVAGGHGPIRGAILGAEGADVGQSEGGPVGVESEEDALVSDLDLCDYADLGAEVGERGAGGGHGGVLTR